jgi:hypothetical protein
MQYLGDMQLLQHFSSGRHTRQHSTQEHKLLLKLALILPLEVVCLKVPMGLTLLLTVMLFLGLFRHLLLLLGTFNKIIALSVTFVMTCQCHQVRLIVSDTSDRSVF